MADVGERADQIAAVRLNAELLNRGVERRESVAT
jgi:hypothetical protein